MPRGQTGNIWSCHHDQGLSHHVCACHPLCQAVHAQELLVTLPLPHWCWGQPLQRLKWGGGAGMGGQGCGVQGKSQGTPLQPGAEVALCPQQAQELPQPNPGAGRHKPPVPSQRETFSRPNTEPWASQALGMAPIPQGAVQEAAPTAWNCV